MYATRSQTKKLAQTQNIATSVNQNREFELNKREKDIKEKEEQYKRDLEEIDRHYHEIYAKLLNVQKKEEALIDLEMKLDNQEDELAIAKKAFRLEKEALNNYENRLKKREAELAKREAALLKTTGEKTSKQIKVMYTSNYSAKRAESFVIGHFTNEKAAVDGVIEWLFENSMGGFDMNNLTQLFDHRDIESETDYETEAEFIKYYQKKCKNFKQLREVLSTDGNGYFEDPCNGWKLIII